MSNTARKLTNNGHRYLIEALEKFVAEAPNETAFICRQRSVSWKQFKLQVDVYVSALAKYSECRVLLFLDGRSDMDMALLVASSVALPQAILISTFHNQERAVRFLQDFNADVVLGLENEELRTLAENPHSESKSFESGATVGLLTSGTTGKAKCVQHNWDSLASAVRVKERYRGQRWLMGYHITNFAGTQVFLQCFLNRGCMVMPSEWPPGNSTEADLIVQHKVDYLNCTATYARRLLLTMRKEAVGTLKHVTLGGEIVDQPLINSLKKKFPNAKISHIYASTEFGASIEVRDEREGFPFEFIDGENLKIEDGELYLRPSKRSMIGYLDQTEGNITGVIRIPLKGESNWAPTGDLVELNGDRVLFLGRKDLVINVGGFKVNPVMVEGVIRNLEGVKDVLVAPQKSPVVGHLLKAKVIPVKGHDHEQLKMAILAHCRSKLPYYSVPRLFEFVNELSYTSSTKLKR